MNRPGPSGGTGTKSTAPSANSKSLLSKTQLLSDYRNRLRGALRSAAENIQGLAVAAKVSFLFSFTHIFCLYFRFHLKNYTGIIQSQQKLLNMELLEMNS